MNRHPLQNEAMEVGCFAAVFADWATWYDVAEIVEDKDFWHEDHRHLFRAMEASAAAADDGTPNYHGILAALTTAGQPWIHQLAMKIGTQAQGAVGAAKLARGVRALSIRRAAVARFADLQERALDLSQDAEAFIADAASEVEDLAPTAFDSVVDRRTVLQEGFAIYEAAVDGRIEPTITTGITELDEMLGGGWRFGELAAWGGATGMGKTASMIGFLRAACKQGHGVYAAITESSRQLWSLRIMAQEARVSFTRIRLGKLNEAEQGRLIDAMGRMKSWNFHLDDGGDISAERIALRARRLHRRQGVRLILADYYQRLEPHPRYKPEQRVQALSNVSKVLLNLAKEKDAEEAPKFAVVCAAQVPDDVAHKRPSYNSIADCRQLSKDAAVVGFTYRPSRANPEDTDINPADAEYVIRKTRNGQDGIIRLGFMGESMLFHDRDDDGNHARADQPDSDVSWL